MALAGKRLTPLFRESKRVRTRQCARWNPQDEQNHAERQGQEMPLHSCAALRIRSVLARLLSQGSGKDRDDFFQGLTVVALLGNFASQDRPFHETIQ